MRATNGPATVLDFVRLSNNLGDSDVATSDPIQPWPVDASYCGYGVAALSSVADRSAPDAGDDGYLLAGHAPRLPQLR